MSKKMKIGPYSAYAIAVKYGYTGTEEQWVKEQETNRVASEQAAQQAEQARDDAETAATRAENAADNAESAQQATESAKTDALTAIGTSKRDALDSVQEVQNGAVAAVSAAKTAATEAIQTAQNAATGAVSDAQTTAVNAVDAKGKEALANISTGIDATLSVSGKAADAKATGDAIGELKEDTDALSSKLEKNEKRAERAEATAQYAIKMQQGYTYELKTIVGSGSEIDVPVGAKDYAGLRKIGGMSRKGYQLLQDNFPVSSSQLSVTKNGNYNYTVTTISSGIYTQSSKTVDMSGLAGMYTLHAEIVGAGGLIMRFYSPDGKNLAETTITSNSQEKTISVAEDFKKLVLVFLGNLADVQPIGTSTTISSIMLELGNTAHNWEPYTADLITATVDSVVSKRGGGEIIHTTTLPPEMLALCPDYGQGTAESYNYIDFEAKSYHHVGSMTQNGVWAALDTPEIINLSAAWPDDLELLTVASGGTVQMHYPKLDDEFEVAVPSEIVFLIDIEKVIKE